MHSPSLLVLQQPSGGDRNFGYLAADETAKRAVLIDPSPVPDMLIGEAGNRGFHIEYVFVTHDHPDHTAGARRAAASAGRQILGLGSRDRLSGRAVSHGSRFPLGGLKIEILHTPGHTEDSICLLIGDALFSGDTLFVGKVGGTDLTGGAEALYDSLRRIILALPDSTRVFPGHDYGTAPVSSIGRERRSNPFLLRDDLSSFIDLKRNWSVYKRTHGIA